MNSKILELLLKEMAHEIVTKEGTTTSRLEALVKSSNGKIEKAIQEHRPILKARLDSKKAELVASIAEIDMILEEIKAP